MFMNPVFDNSVPCLICKKEQWKLITTVKRREVTFNLKICSNCGFVAQNPPLSEEFLQHYYEHNYVRNNYSNTLAAIHQTMLKPASARMKYLKENSYLLKLHRVLEIGPGAGSMMKLFSNHRIDIAGIEPDRDAVNWIRDNLKLPIFQGFFDTVYEKEKEGWFKNLYDGIVITHVLEHVSDPLIFFSKLKKIMIPDGLIIVEVPNIERPFSDEKEWESYCDPGHLYYFSENTLKNLLYQSGLEPIAITDKIFEPYGNLFCVAKKADNISSIKVPVDDVQRIRIVWNQFIKHHPWRRWKCRVISKFERIFL